MAKFDEVNVDCKKFNMSFSDIANNPGGSCVSASVYSQKTSGISFEVYHSAETIRTSSILKPVNSLLTEK